LKTPLFAGHGRAASACVDQHRLLGNPKTPCNYPDRAANIPADHFDLTGRASAFYVTPDDLVVAHSEKFEIVWGSGLEILLGSGRGAIEFRL